MQDLEDVLGIRSYQSTGPSVPTEISRVYITGSCAR